MDNLINITEESKKLHNIFLDYIKVRFSLRKAYLFSIFSIALPSLLIFSLFSFNALTFDGEYNGFIIALIFLSFWALLTSLEKKISKKMGFAKKHIQVINSFNINSFTFTDYPFLMSNSLLKNIANQLNEVSTENLEFLNSVADTYCDYNRNLSSFYYFNRTFIEYKVFKLNISDFKTLKNLIEQCLSQNNTLELNDTDITFLLNALIINYIKISKNDDFINDYESLIILINNSSFNSEEKNSLLNLIKDKIQPTLEEVLSQQISKINKNKILKISTNKGFKIKHL